MSARIFIPPDLLERITGNAGGEPEHVLRWTPRTGWPSAVMLLLGRGRWGLWELLTFEEYQAGVPARLSWQHEAPEDVYPLRLAAWTRVLLGYPVVLEEGEAEIRSRFGRWQTVPLYWVRRNSRELWISSG